MRADSGRVGSGHSSTAATSGRYPNFVRIGISGAVFGRAEDAQTECRPGSRSPDHPKVLETGRPEPPQCLAEGL